MAFNAFMPGADNWMRGQPMPGQAPQIGMPAAPAMTGQPQKPRPIMNAFSKIFEIGAPEAFEAGRQKKLTQNLGNALAGGDYSGAAEMALRGGQIDTGLKLRGMADERSQAQMAEQRKAEAQGTYQLFSTMQAPQINDYAMQDPVGFERMTGMSSEEYLQAAQQFQRVGMSPDQFRAFVIQQAQAELGIENKPTEYGFQNVGGVGLVRTDPHQGTAETVVAAPEKPTAQWEDYTPPGGTPGLFQRNTLTGEIELVAAAPSSGGGGGQPSYGVTPIYGRDKDGNRVALQTSNAGGIMQVQLPEGVTLEDDYGKTLARETAKADAKKAAYETQAGMAVLAAEESFTRLSAQIDDAIEKSTDRNTGFWGSKLPATDLDGLLETIGAVTAFDTLVALKAQGGTLGALSDTELNLLKSKVANLARSQSQEQLDANLELLKYAMQGSMQRIKQAYESEYAAGAYGSPRPATQNPTGSQGAPPPPPGFELIP